MPTRSPNQWLVDDVKSGSKVILFTDEIRCPIWVDTIAQSVLELANTAFTGFINIAGPEPSKSLGFRKKSS